MISKKKILLIAIVVVVVAAVGIGLFLWQSLTAGFAEVEDTIEAYLDESPVMMLVQHGH